MQYEPPKQPLGKRLLRYWPLYVMLLPCIVYYILICYVPWQAWYWPLRIIHLRKESGEAHGWGLGTLRRSFPAMTLQGW